jgi:hypothetical protein
MVLEGNADIVIKSVIRTFTTFNVVTIAEKKAGECFADKSRYCYRDDLLLSDQCVQEASGFSVQYLDLSSTFKQVVESFLGVSGGIPLLSRELIVRGCTTTLSVIEWLIERQEEHRENLGLWTNGRSNFFFVKESHEEGMIGSVSVVRVNLDDGRWDVYKYGLGCSDLWRDGQHFFFRKPL